VIRPVSVVIPALDDRELLARHLPPLLAELGRRGGKDEVILVDDTGDDVLASWAGERYPGVRCVANASNSGFAAALLAGFEAAGHELVFSMNPDVLVRPGFLDPLVSCFDASDVHAAVPRVLLSGESDAIESLFEIVFEDGEIRLKQPALAGRDARPGPIQPTPVPFAIGGTSLFLREPFLARGGFDPLFGPFYFEDVDLGWTSWRQGGRTLYQPASVVEHHHRGTISKAVPADLVRAAWEKNRLLFHWKHLDEPELLRQHLAYLYRFALDAWLGDRREELVWLALALEQKDAALAARTSAGPGFSDLCEELARPRR